METLNRRMTVFFYNRMTLFSCVSPEGHCQAADDCSDDNNALETDFFSQMNEVLFPAIETTTDSELEAICQSLMASANDQLTDFLSANPQISRAQIISEMKPFTKEIGAFGVPRYSGEIPWKEVAQFINNGRTAMELQKAWRFHKHSANPLAKEFDAWDEKESGKLAEVCGNSYKHDWEQVATTVMNASDGSRAKTALCCLQKHIRETKGKHFDGLRKGAFSKEESDALRQIVRQSPLGFEHGTAADSLGTRTPLQVYHMFANEFPNGIHVFGMETKPELTAMVLFKAWLLADIYALKPDSTNAKIRGAFGHVSRHLCHFGERRVRDIIQRTIAQVLDSISDRRMRTAVASVTS